MWWQNKQSEPHVRCSWGWRRPGRCFLLCFHMSLDQQHLDMNLVTVAGSAASFSSSAPPARPNTPTRSHTFWGFGCRFLRKQSTLSLLMGLDILFLQVLTVGEVTFQSDFSKGAAHCCLWIFNSVFLTACAKDKLGKIPFFLCVFLKHINKTQCLW